MKPASALADMESALRAQGGGFDPGRAGLPPAPKPPEPRKIREGDILLGAATNHDQIGISLAKLIEGRLLIQGNSGAGKSMLLRRIFEQSWGKVQQIVVDPDGEFLTLAEKFDLAVVGINEITRLGGRTLALHIRQHRYSAILDFSNATSEQRMEIVGDLAAGLIEAAPEHWHPLLVLIDEAQTFAPHYDTGDVDAETRKRATSAIADMMGRGRKRGVAGVIATQRLAETSKAVAFKATNVIVGRTIFDRDLERAGDALGYTAGHSRALRTLADGEFIGIGPAFNMAGRGRFKAGSVETKHKGEAPKIDAPPIVSAKDATALLGQVEATETDNSQPSTVFSRKAGKRGIDWSQAHDAIIREGYTKGTPLAAIGQLLSAAGLEVSTSGISTRAHALGLIAQKATLGWSTEEDEILRDGYLKELKIIEIVTHLAESGFSRGRVAVQMRAIALGITRDRVNYWTKEETDIALAGLEAGKSTREIIVDLKAAGFERGVTGITKFAQKHGISRNSAVPWTDGDVAKLTEMYNGNKSIAEIMQELDRSRGAIMSMAHNLGLKQRLPWTDQEKDVLRKAQADGLKLIDVPPLLPGRTYATVARMAGQLRLDFALNRKVKSAKPNTAKKKGKR